MPPQMLAEFAFSPSYDSAHIIFGRRNLIEIKLCMKTFIFMSINYLCFNGEKNLPAMLQNGSNQQYQINRNIPDTRTLFNRVICMMLLYSYMM